MARQRHRKSINPYRFRRDVQRPDWSSLLDLDLAHETLTRYLRSDRPDRGAIEAAHRHYHQTLLARCPSGWMLRILDLLNSHVIRYWTLSAAPRRDTEAVIAEHDRIHEFVRSGKTDVASAELAAHLQHALHSVLERMTESALEDLSED